MATATAEEKAKAAAQLRETRAENRELEKSARKMKNLAGAAKEQLANLSAKAEKFKEQIGERDSAERSLLVSVTSAIGSNVIQLGSSAAVDAVANRWPWLNKHRAYAKAVPGLVVGLGISAGELATRGKGLIGMGREITARLGDGLVVLGMSRAMDAYRQAQAQAQAQVKAALAQAQAAQAQADQAKG